MGEAPERWRPEVKARPVAIIWSDAAHIGAGQWLETPLGDTSIEITTVGLLVRKTKTHLVIAHSLDEDGNVTGVFSIPRSAVRKVHPLSK